MISPFQLYIFGRTHVWSLIAVSLSIIIGIYLLRRKYNFLTSTMMSLSIAVLGHNFYETVFNTFLYFGKTSIGYIDNAHFIGVLSFVLGLIATLAVISIINTHKPFITFKKLKTFLVMLLFLLLSLLLLFQFNFYSDLTLWLFYDGVDPHGLLWAISKILGFMVFLPFINSS